MKRASTGNEAKFRTGNGAVSNQRLVAAGTRALEAHARVRRIAERLDEELDHVTSPHGIPTADLDPGDSVVIAVEKAITTAKRAEVIPPPSPLATPRVSTRLGVVPLVKATAKGG